MVALCRHAVHGHLAVPCEHSFAVHNHKRLANHVHSYAVEEIRLKGVRVAHLTGDDPPNHELVLFLARVVQHKPDGSPCHYLNVAGRERRLRQFNGNRAGIVRLYSAFSAGGH